MRRRRGGRLRCDGAQSRRATQNGAINTINGIIGAPGGGKTFLTNTTAMDLAREALRQLDERREHSRHRTFGVAGAAAKQFAAAHFRFEGIR